VASGAAVTVILASYGYPHAPRTGDVIEGLGDDGQLAQAVAGVTVFHAGTAIDAEGRFITAGGRALAVTGVGATLAEARRRAYEGAALITFEGRVMRSDIALSVA
jgi:phosphoribosylamine--glycine ligase